MNFFSGWLLTSALKVDLFSESEFNACAKESSGILINVLSEAEFYSDSALYMFARKLFGEFKLKTLYPYSSNGKEFFFVVPTDEPKKLSHEKPGKAHIASYIGSILSNQLNSFTNQIENQSVFLVSLSQDIKELIIGEHSEFIIGLIQKSISNKIKKTFTQSLSQKRIVLSESLFSFEEYKRALAISDAMSYTRTFVNMPPNSLTPETYEVILRFLVKSECEKAGLPNHIQIDIWDFAKLENEGCGLICAVGKGSAIKPRLVKLTYSPKKTAQKIPHVALVGKGITFDSGGYDIKPSSSMRNMKKDMGGSAAALGIFFACARMNLAMHLTCWLPLAENMVSSQAMRPGDIYKARNGFQVEIENTDAEGRLVLADAVSLACEENPDWLIDLATLTGAARVSLGSMVDSLFGNHPETNELLHSAGLETGDWVWPMPLPQEYESYFDSSVADFMNSSTSGYAGSITAALFIRKFVTVARWNHIDTFMWCDRPNGLWSESGPTGKCVRLVTKAIENFISKSQKLS
ncbi:M17 family metallopeptidase [Fluviispira multicolorata]|uniref:Leucyl aminopeptidase n=1 Tax=Fluviispira multicolorata TaxID=2654512 RepID=A0A833N484_9BACT|nr:leucyl aminopeptidase family protein [Fluviispira multicolorata]KAB8030001.1 leucyl aminopeptidase [Fluviispira multicolorata]